MSDVEPLAPASNLYDLRDRIQEVRQRLNGMTPDWWVRERMPPDDPSAAVVHDPEDSAARCRLEAAKEYRDVLRLAAMRLASQLSNVGLPEYPAEDPNPERDMFDVLWRWVMGCLSDQGTDHGNPGQPDHVQRARKGKQNSRGRPAKGEAEVKKNRDFANGWKDAKMGRRSFTEYCEDEEVDEKKGRAILEWIRVNPQKTVR